MQIADSRMQINLEAGRSIDSPLARSSAPDLKRETRKRNTDCRWQDANKPSCSMDSLYVISVS
ncbi:MAG: hypothetical protein V1799_00745 [bacterium]